MRSEIIDRPAFTCQRLDSGVLRFYFKKDVKVSLEDAQEMTRLKSELSNNSKHFMLINAENIKSVSQPMRDHIVSPEAVDNVVGVAIVAKSLVGQTIGRFLIRIKKPPFKMEVFRDEKIAEEWLLGLEEIGACELM